ncbi:MAG: hypothetical protein IJ730_01505, partial [Alphaproteobacteria bacterium]|nr:hypothetical protein [Alphaproteobacteria bacterium]
MKKNLACCYLSALALLSEQSVFASLPSSDLQSPLGSDKSGFNTDTYSYVKPNINVGTPFWLEPTFKKSFNVEIGIKEKIEDDNHVRLITKNVSFSKKPSSSTKNEDFRGIEFEYLDKNKSENNVKIRIPLPIDKNISLDKKDLLALHFAPVGALLLKFFAWRYALEIMQPKGFFWSLMTRAYDTINSFFRKKDTDFNEEQYRNKLPDVCKAFDTLHATAINLRSAFKKLRTMGAVTNSIKGSIRIYINGVLFQLPKDIETYFYLEERNIFPNLKESELSNIQDACLDFSVNTLIKTAMDYPTKAIQLNCKFDNQLPFSSFTTIDRIKNWISIPEQASIFAFKISEEVFHNKLSLIIPTDLLPLNNDEMLFNSFSDVIFLKRATDQLYRDIVRCWSYWRYVTMRFFSCEVMLAYMGENNYWDNRCVKMFQAQNSRFSEILKSYAPHDSMQSKRAAEIIMHMLGQLDNSFIYDFNQNNLNKKNQESKKEDVEKIDSTKQKNTEVPVEEKEIKIDDVNKLIENEIEQSEKETKTNELIKDKKEVKQPEKNDITPERSNNTPKTQPKKKSATPKVQPEKNDITSKKPNNTPKTQPKKKSATPKVQPKKKKTA